MNGQAGGAEGGVPAVGAATAATEGASGEAVRAASRHREPLLAVWGRRAISVPFYVALAAVCFGGAPVWLLAALFADAIGRRRRWPRTRTLGFFAIYLGCEIAGIALASALGILTLGGRVGGAARYLAANAALQRAWTGALFAGATWIFSMRVEVLGLEVAKRGPLLLFVRHSSTADTVLAAALVANPGHLLLRYVLKRELLWDPCLDLVGRRLPNAFVDRKAPRSQGEIDAVARLAVGLDPASAVLIYPEGTRFSAAKLPAALDALRAKGQARLAELAATFRHVLPPRLGGALALLRAAPGVDVVFLEHTGFEGAATLGELWGGGLVGKTLRVRLRRFAAETIPEQGRDVWLFERWGEVDAWVGQWKGEEGEG